MNSTCPVCGTDSWREVFKAFKPKQVQATGKPTEALYGRAGTLVRCRSCGLVRQEVAQDAHYEEAEDEDYLTEEAGLRATFLATVDHVGRFRAPPGRFLDVGCGPGLLLEEAQRRGWTAVGVEPSRWAVDVARARGLDVRQGTSDDDWLEPGSFDAIVANDVIEHVPDPRAFARRLHDLLAPDGVLFLCTPNVGSLIARTLRRWWWSILPGHLFYFSPATLSQLLSSCGFSVLETGTHPKTFSLEYYAGRFVGYSNALAKLGRVAVKPFGGPKRLVSPDFRDRIAMVAARNG